MTTGLRGDGEARRHRQTQSCHLGEVGPLAPQEVCLIPTASGKVINECGHGPIAARRKRLPLGTSVHVSAGGTEGSSHH